MSSPQGTGDSAAGLVLSATPRERWVKYASWVVTSRLVGSAEMRRGRRRLSKPVESFTGDRNREHDHPTRGVVLPVAVLSETGWGASIDADESRGHGAGRDRTRRTHRQVIDTRAPRPLRCVWIFNLLLRQRVRWDYPPVNSGPLAQGSVPVWFGAPRFGDSGIPPVARGRGGGRRVLGTGGNRVAGEVQRREHQADDLHRDAGDVGGRGDCRDALIVAVELARRK